MQKKVNLAMLALFSCSLAMAQNEKTDQNIAQGLDENAFTYAEAQLGEDDDMSSNVTIYTTETGSTLNSFTFTYDVISVNSKYFTIWNNTVGALYIEKIIITLK